MYWLSGLNWVDCVEMDTYCDVYVCMSWDRNRILIDVVVIVIVVIIIVVVVVVVVVIVVGVIVVVMVVVLR